MEKERRPRFKPAQQEVADGRAECYWCDRVFDAKEMTKENQHGMAVYVCKACGRN